MKETINIILIWGTFARDADWVQQDSFLRQNLREHLDPEIDVDFHIHDWTGGNTHKDRNDGSVSLANTITELKMQSDRRLFVIGHSHGGSVANNAMNYLRENTKPDGIITMGSPFFIVRPRNIYLIGFMIAIMTFFFSFTVLAQIGEYIDASDEISKLYFNSIIFMALILAIGSTSYVKHGKTLKDSESKSKGLSKSHEIPILSINTFPDEANVLLNFWTLFTGLFQAVWALAVILLPLQIVLTINELVSAASQIDGVSGLFGLIVVLQFFIMAIALAVVVGMAGLVALSIFLLSLAVGAIRGQFFAFGGESKLWHLFYKIRISKLANPQSESIFVRSASPLFQGELRHSSFYNDEVTCRIIASKIRDWEVIPSPLRWAKGVVISYFLPPVILIVVLMTLSNALK